MLIVVDALQVPARFSGVGRQVLSIAAELHKLPEELDLEIRCPADVRPLLESLVPARTRFRTPIPRSRPRVRRIAYQQLAAPARDRGRMLLVALGDQGPAWGRVPVLLVLNDLRRLTHPGTSGRLETAYYRVVTPRAARHASSLATISEFSRDQIRRVLGDDVNPRVVADHPAPRVDRPVGGIESGPFVFVSALRRYKGIETAIDALALLPEGSRRALVLAGTGEGREEALRRYAHERGVGDLVTFAGWLADAQLADLYGRCLAAVNPSTYEGYGLPVAESLSYGVPTLASAIPPHREIAGDAALYFEPGDACGLAEAMGSLADPGLRVSLGARALARSRELAALGPRWAELILDAVAKTQSA